MARKKEIINPIAGQRVKIVCEEQNITQAKLAELIYLSTKTISSMIRGHSRVTEATARSIVNVFPNDYSVEWILGLDDYKTEAESRDAFMHELTDIKSKSDMVFEWLLSANGWTMHLLPTNDSAHSVCYFKNKDGSSFILDDLDMYAFRGEILDYVGLRMKSMSETYQRKKSEESR